MWRIIHYCINDYVTIKQERVKKYLEKDVPYIIDILKNISVMLINENPILAYSRLEKPNVIYFNDIYTQIPPPSLPKICKL